MTESNPVAHKIILAAIIFIAASSLFIFVAGVGLLVWGVGSSMTPPEVLDVKPRKKAWLDFDVRFAGSAFTIDPAGVRVRCRNLRDQARYRLQGTLEVVLQKHGRDVPSSGRWCTIGGG